MRPSGTVGEIRAALLQAAHALVTDERAPTMRELAAKACVGVEAALRTVKDMKRYGDLTVPRTRRVEYRNRPVAEYAPASKASTHDEFVDVQGVFSVWARG